MAHLILGPIQRYVGTTDATVWVETDEPCEVSVLGATTPTFTVCGHHYALVRIGDLQPGTVHEYDVRLDGEQVWPPQGDPFPPPVIRTTSDDPSSRFRVVFGSCRVAAPHEPPWTLDRSEHREGRGTDALVAYALRMAEEPYEQWPDVVLFLGDQVYADDASPRTRAYIRGKRDTSEAPGEEMADFDEYAQLYREAWEEPRIRWVVSTVPTAMIFDDHEIIDDWNISGSWRRDARQQPWWEERITGGLAAYWVYQHVGNLSPSSLDRDRMYAEVVGGGDVTEVIFAHARGADLDTSTARWSYDRDLGSVRLVVVDSRAGRVLSDGRRDMLDEAEWEFIEERSATAARHLLLASSLPFLLPRGIHGLEAWNEAVCEGAWGGFAARIGERIRRAIDLEHWAAFRRSFERFVALLRRVGSGEDGDAPSTIVLLSGDVHFSYAARVAFPPHAGVRSRVHQVVASPMRNTVEIAIRRVHRFAGSSVGERLGRWLQQGAGVPELPIRWRLTHGPWFHNVVAVLEFEDDEAHLRFEATTGEGRAIGDRAVLEVVAETSL